ncbi:hypothetical protein N7488_005148 [Penicillium malachiteum]|nr:hypothetical protein N7488_005148 [Penicillium malachiteum]
MSEPIKVEYIGWEDDFRYAEEKSRITEQIQKIAEEKGFAYACVQSQGPWMDVHFMRAEWLTDGVEKYVFTRLWFNEDGDLDKDPEFFEVEKGSL